MTYTAYLKMSITVDDDSERENAILEANRIVNAINRECDYPKLILLNVDNNGERVTMYDLISIDNGTIRNIL